MNVVKIRSGQAVPPGDWDEVVYAIGSGGFETPPPNARIAMPVWTPEGKFNSLRSNVKRLMREGFVKYEASDLATLRMLKSLGAKDLTADWTLYAFNRYALKLLSDLGVKRFVASPENNAGNLAFLKTSGFEVEFLSRQSTPLFISVTRPEAQSELAVFRLGDVWVTTKRTPREWPGGTRVDYSWDPGENDDPETC